MQKKLIALAVAGVASTAAFAQSNVTIYGDLKPSFDSMKVESQNGRFGGIASNNSNIGFKGEENLGNGLKAIFQIESGVGIGGTAGTSAPQGGTLGGRNTFVGLAGGFGEVTIGRRDTAYKTVSGSYDPFADTIGDYNNIIGSAFRTSAAFDVRGNSSVNYTSPSFAGVKVSYSHSMQADNATTAQDDNINSFAATYDNGGLNLLAGYEKQAGSASAGNQNRDAWKLGAKYNFGAASVFGLYETAELKDTAAGLDRKRDAWYIGGTYAIGAVDLLATYAKAKKETGAAAIADSSATNWNIGARYNLSKRTNILAAYTDLDNKAGAQYSLFTKGAINGVGQDVKGFSVRVQHKF